MKKLTRDDFPTPIPQHSRGIPNSRDDWDDVPYHPNENCLKCKGYGFLYGSKEGLIDYSIVVPCRAPGCLLDSIRGKVPSETIKQTFDNFIQVPGSRDAYKLSRALAYGSSDFIWLLIYGGTGNGKTHLCNAIARATRDRGIQTQMILTADLFSMLRDAIHTGTADQLLRKFKDVDFLAIDDYGVEYGSEWEQAKFDELMTSRFATCKPTVLITNKELTNLPERIQSRFNDRKLARAVQNEAPDYRVAKR